ncbi:MAG: hypothetical protein MZV70_22700 [Desulfobacterales bacterium]|nr:hypothetical protein [Desulfobacterales bacterium]
MPIKSAYDIDGLHKYLQIKMGGVRMNNELRILILEDTASDAELMEDELKQAGLVFIAKRVATKADFVRQME